MYSESSQQRMAPPETFDSVRSQISNGGIKSDYETLAWSRDFRLLKLSDVTFNPGDLDRTKGAHGMER